MVDSDEDFLVKLNRKVRADPLVPFGCLVTVGFLTAGLRSFSLGKANLSQQMMRARVLAQAATVTVVGVGTFLLGSGVPSSTTRPDNHAEINAMSTIDPATLAQIDLGIKKKQAEKNADTSGMIAAIEAARQAREGK